MSKKIVSSGSAYNVTEVQNAETILNKTTTLSSSSTDTEYASAKATYDAIQAGSGGATDLNAVHYTADTGKTEEQKTQARTNIGAGTYSKPDGGIPSADLAEAYLPLTAGDTKKLTGTLWSGLAATSEPMPAFQWNVGTGTYAYNLQLAATSSDASHVTYSARVNTGGVAVTDRIIWRAVLYENSTSNSLYLGDTAYFSDVYLQSATNLTLEAKSEFASARSYIKLEGTNVAVGNSSRNNIMYPRNGTSNTAYLGCSSSVDSSVGNKYWTRTFTDNITMTLNGTRQDLATYLATKEDTSNKVTSISSSSTDTQYPSAKLVYDATQTLQTEINNLKSIGRFLAILDASNGTVSSQPFGSVGDSYSYKVGDYYRVGTAGTYVPKSTATYIIDETSGSSNFEQGSVSYGIGDLIYCSNLTETTSTWVKQQSSGGGTVQDVQVNGTSILSGGIANITSGNLPSHIHTLANITDVSATATEINYLSGTTSNVQTQLDSKGTYSKPEDGIPSSDMTTAVQTSLGKADTSIQQHDEYVQSITVGTTGGTARDTALGIGTNADDAYIDFATKSTSRGKLGVSKNNEPLFYNHYTSQRQILATQTWTSTQLAGKEDTSNKVTSISSSSTDTQYPSAKLVYDQLALKQSTLTVNPATTSASLTSIGINGTNYSLAGGTQVIWRTY